MGLLSYVKTIWKAGKSGGTPFTPDRFNNIEDGIEQATNELNEKEKRIENLETSVGNINSNLNKKGIIYLGGATVVGDTTLTVKKISSFDYVLLTFNLWTTQQVASNLVHTSAFNSTDKSIYVQYIDYDGNTRNGICSYLSDTSAKINIPATGYYINLYGIKL